MKNEFPNGVWPVMLTPYTEDNKIDYPALEKLTEWYFEITLSPSATESQETIVRALVDKYAPKAKIKESSLGKVVRLK